MHKRTVKNKFIQALLSIVIFLCILMSFLLFEVNTAQAASAEWNGTIATGFAGGTGTAANPYLISTGEQLAYFSQRVNAGTTYSGKYIQLTQSIILNAMKPDGTFVSATPREFTSIGSNGDDYRGNFDGNGYRIIGLYINQPTLDQQGLFGYGHEDSVIQNVAVSGSVTGRDHVAGIVGESKGTVLICANACTVTGQNIVGGIIGYAGSHSQIRNCFNSGTITGIDGVGGISGKVDKNNIQLGNNLSVGDVIGTTNWGGVAGYYSASLPETWNNYCLEEPATGIIVADSPDDSAVPISSLPPEEQSWEVIIDLLNGIVPDDSQNLDGDDIWGQIIGGDGDEPPGIGVFVPPVSVSSAKIEEGKHYTAAALVGDTSSAITSDSVFTVVFNTSYAESYSLENQTLGLSKDNTVVHLPANSSIIMRVDGSYYYLNLTDELDEKVFLSEFIKMGSSTEHYIPPVQITPGNAKEYLFIFDFSKTAGILASGISKVELLDAEGYGTGTRPTVTTAGKNTYTLGANGATDMFTASLAKISAPGYDYKTDGKIYAYEFYLEKDGAIVPLPIGTKVNGTVIATSLPYAFTSAVFEDPVNISFDMSDCANPLVPGSYDLQIKAYACTDILNPRNGYVLKNEVANITLTEPTPYAIRANAIVETRVIDQSTFPGSIEFAMQILGSDIVMSTLQRKYGMVYVNIPDQLNQPVTITGGSTTLTIPGGYQKGTYRFLFVLYDSNGIEKAQTVQNIIIK